MGVAVMVKAASEMVPAMTFTKSVSLEAWKGAAKVQVESVFPVQETAVTALGQERGALRVR